MTDKKVYISSDNIGKYAKVQGASAMAQRDEIVLLWDELDKSEKKLARDHIEIPDVQVVTTDPYNVPDKWNDNIIEEDGDPEAHDLIKQVIANPNRKDVYDLLKEVDPPEPLMLWWADACFTEPEYFELLAEMCRYGLFRADTKYLWAVMAFGVEDGKGKFHWPSNDDTPAEEKKIKKKVLEEYDIREKELEEAWDDVKGLSGAWVELDEGEAEVVGAEVQEVSEEDGREASASLLDF